MPTQTHLRPSDSEALGAAFRELHKRSEFDVVFGGECVDGSVALRNVLGGRSHALREVEVESGRGLGGRVLKTRRPAEVRDYENCDAITTHYRHAVNREGLRTIIAMPVVVGGGVRAMLYGGLRAVSSLGDATHKVFATAANNLAIEYRVRDDVDRRLSMAEVASAEAKHGLEPTDRERLRLLHGELHAIAAELGDNDLGRRLLAAGDSLARVGMGPNPAAPDVDATPGMTSDSRKLLSPREVAVLSQVALGCSNAEVAARLSLSPDTIKTYMRNISGKLETHSRMESVARARLLGYLP